MNQEHKVVEIVYQSKRWPNLQTSPRLAQPKQSDNTSIRVTPNKKTETRVSRASTIFTTGNVKSSPSLISYLEIRAKPCRVPKISENPSRQGFSFLFSLACVSLSVLGVCRLLKAGSKTSEISIKPIFPIG
ncbi:hypothetical protein YC2023_066575 [Brassica napus]